jgi:hypothetical protein
VKAGGPHVIDCAGIGSLIAGVIVLYWLGAFDLPIWIARSLLSLL